VNYKLFPWNDAIQVLVHLGRVPMLVLIKTSNAFICKIVQQTRTENMASSVALKRKLHCNLYIHTTVVQGPCTIVNLSSILLAVKETIAH